MHSTRLWDSKENSVFYSHSKSECSHHSTDFFFILSLYLANYQIPLKKQLATISPPFSVVGDFAWLQRSFWFYCPQWSVSEVVPTFSKALKGRWSSTACSQKEKSDSLLFFYRKWVTHVKASTDPPWIKKQDIKVLFAVFFSLKLNPDRNLFMCVVLSSLSDRTPHSMLANLFFFLLRFYHWCCGDSQVMKIKVLF